MKRQLEKYYNKRALTSPWQLAGTSRNNFQAAIIIPALAESQSLPQTIASLATNPDEYLQQTLIVIVINNRQSASSENKADNRLTIEWLQNDPYPQLNIAWVDAASDGLELPEKEGVGLARKIGFDLSLPLLDWAAQPLLISLDADTLVDANYLPAISQHFETTRCGGATIPFRHQSTDTPEQDAAIRCYELYLRSYLFGLKQAGSPYAYHTVGSAFACLAGSYVAAGGMNRRHAAEDFYFIQQLAKTCGVEMLQGTVVHPSARFSDRVPFGTGKAVQGQVKDRQQLFQFSSAKGFIILRQWLELVCENLDEPAEVLLEQASRLSPRLHTFLAELNFAATWERLQKNYGTPQKRLTAFHGWFDGLRTRQMLSRVESDPDASFETKVAELLKWGGRARISHWPEQLQLLEQLQGVDIS